MIKGSNDEDEKIVFFICKCGGETENADEQTKCPDCHRIGCWVESEDQGDD